MEWRVYLEGDDFDLKTLSGVFNSDSEIVKEDNQFYLISNSFDGVKDSKVIRKIAKDKIEAINAFSRASLGLRNTFTPLSISHVKKLEKNSKTGEIEATADIVLRDNVDFKERLTARELDEKENIITESKTGMGIREYFELSNQREEVENFIGYLMKRNSWKNYYNIIEYIQDNLDETEKNIVDLGLISKTKKEILEKTANDTATLGADARHGNKKINSENPMTFDEATKVIDNLIKNWLDYKAELYLD